MRRKKYVQRFKKPYRQPKWKKSKHISFSEIYKKWKYK